jgi:hypothetical protein
VLKHLIIKPRAGLANRLRTIASARRICARTGARCSLLWSWGDPRLLLAMDGIEEISQAPPGVRVAYHESQRGGPHKVPINGPDEIIVDSCMVFFADDEQRLHERKLAEWLPAPAPALQQRAAITAEGWRNDVLGVHIRAPDNDMTGPTLDALWHRFLPEIKVWPGRIFLCSNDREIEARAARELPQLIQQPKSAGESSRWPRMRDHKANEEDMLDLLLLGSCHHIVGSLWSSFGRIAAVYGGNYDSSLFLPALKEPA